MRATAMKKEVTEEFLQFACGQAVNHAPIALNCELTKHTDYEFGHVPLRAGFTAASESRSPRKLLRTWALGRNRALLCLCSARALLEEAAREETKCAHSISDCGQLRIYFLAEHGCESPRIKRIIL